MPDLLAPALVLSRGTALAALFVLFGTLLLRQALAGPVLELVRPDLGAGTGRSLRRLAWWAWAVSVPALLLWLVLQTADMAGTDGILASLPYLPVVAQGTRFGSVLLLRLLLLALLVPALAIPRGWSRLIAAVLAGLAVTLEAADLHAMAMHPGPSLFLANEALHVLAAGAWLGALPALLLTVAGAPLVIATDVARRFFPLGLGCVLALAVSAVGQGLVLIGSPPALAGTAFGLVCLGKLALFLLLVALAARNKRRLVPRLLGTDPVSARRALVASIGWETAAGLLLVLLAASLSALPPGIDRAP